MSYPVSLSDQFTREAARFFRKHPDLTSRFERLLDDLRTDPFQPSLHLHPLKGKYLGQHAVSLTYAYRIRLVLIVTEKSLVLLTIGTHDEVYR